MNTDYHTIVSTLLPPDPAQALTQQILERQKQLAAISSVTHA